MIIINYLSEVAETRESTTMKIRETPSICISIYCVCVCVREREREDLHPSTTTEEAPERRDARERRKVGLGIVCGQDYRVIKILFIDKQACDIERLEISVLVTCPIF